MYLVDENKMHSHPFSSHLSLWYAITGCGTVVVGLNVDLWSDM